MTANRQHGAMEHSEPPVDLDTVRRYRLGRVREQLKARDLAGALLFDQINARYVTDATNMQIWCSHYEARAVFVATEGPVILWDFGDYPHLAEDLPTVDEYRTMKSFYFFASGTRGEEKAKAFAEEVADVVAAHGGGSKRLAIDRCNLSGLTAFQNAGLDMVEGQDLMELARVIKSTEELMLMRRAVEVCEMAVGQMHEALTPGMTENALYSKLHEANVALGGEWIETRLLSSGPRTNPWMRESSMRVIEKGDMVSFDTDLIGPYGYCCDMSRSWICGDVKPTQEQARVHGLALEQIHFNTELLKPGMSFREYSEKAWQMPSEFVDNRYGVVVHGVGMADEYPSIKYFVDFDNKGYDGIIEPGMTLCVESYMGSKHGGEGVKLEEQVLITDTGCELLTSYSMDL